MKTWCEHMRNMGSKNILSIPPGRATSGENHVIRLIAENVKFCPECGKERPVEKCNNCKNIQPGKMIAVSYEAKCVDCGERVDMNAPEEKQKKLWEIIKSAVAVHKKKGAGMGNSEMDGGCSGIAARVAVEEIKRVYEKWANDIIDRRTLFEVWDSLL